MIMLLLPPYFKDFSHLFKIMMSPVKSQSEDLLLSVVCQVTQFALSNSRFTIKNATHAIYASLVIFRKFFISFINQGLLSYFNFVSWDSVITLEFFLRLTSSACNVWIASINFIIHFTQLVTSLPNSATT